MGLFGNVLKSLVAEAVVKEGFEAGVKGHSPPVQPDHALQVISDRGYELGRDSLKNRAVGTLIEGAERLLGK